MSCTVAAYPVNWVYVVLDGISVVLLHEVYFSARFGIQKRRRNTSFGKQVAFVLDRLLWDRLFLDGLLLLFWGILKQGLAGHPKARFGGHPKATCPKTTFPKATCVTANSLSVVVIITAVTIALYFGVSAAAATTTATTTAAPGSALTGALGHASIHIGIWVQTARTRATSMVDDDIHRSKFFFTWPFRPKMRASTNKTPHWGWDPAAPPPPPGSPDPARVVEPPPPPPLDSYNKGVNRCRNEVIACFGKFTLLRRAGTSGQHGEEAHHCRSSRVLRFCPIVQVHEIPDNAGGDPQEHQGDAGEDPPVAMAEFQPLRGGTDVVQRIGTSASGQHGEGAGTTVVATCEKEEM